MRASARSRLGLGGAAVRDAVEGQLGRRRLRRPPQVRALGATPGCVGLAAQPSRRADPNPPLPTLSLLLFVASLPERRIYPHRGCAWSRAVRSRPRTPTCGGAGARQKSPHRLQPGLRPQVEGAEADLSTGPQAPWTRV